MNILKDPRFKVAISTRVETPDRRPIPYRVLVVGTDIPLSEKQDGYDADEVEKVIEAVRKAMDEVEAEEARSSYRQGRSPPSNATTKDQKSGIM
jgi:hypothetical protein